MATMTHDLATDAEAAWKAYRPGSRNPWTLEKAGHLFRRAAFGATWRELEDALRRGPDATIDRLLAGGQGQERFQRQLERMADSIALAENEQQMRAWWLYRLLYSPHPLQEKLTLFWHDHFATSNAKVNDVGFMLGQNELLRRHALGSFRTMLQEISKDPAMMVWLDTNLSTKGKPNENYARELMELFSLGIGHYTEQDIREAARAFTGWEIRDGQFFFNRSQHDFGDKTVLGRTGNWNGEDIVNICLDQEAAPRFIVRKLFRFLVSETIEPTDELLEPLVHQFRDSDYDIGGVVSTMLRSQLFFSPQAYRSRVKSPIDFAIGIVRGLEGRVGTIALAQALDNLGQRLFYPPSVAGWDGGTAWLNSTTLLLRHNLALALTSTEDPRFGRRTDPVRLARKYGKEEDHEIAQFFLNLFLQGDVPAESRERIDAYLSESRSAPYPVYWTEQDVAEHRIRTVCHLVLTLPEFQLS